MNGVIVPMYSYRERSYAWAKRSIAAAEAVHGEPVPTCLCGARLDENTARHGELCEDCKRAGRE